jgi:hypothetical protein
MGGCEGETVFGLFAIVLGRRSRGWTIIEKANKKAMEKRRKHGKRNAVTVQLCG